ncbi:MAG: hypothetical protein AAGA46_00175 [Cyanobacteria bacterium P01_F01_bin.13]
MSEFNYSNFSNRVAAFGLDSNELEQFKKAQQTVVLKAARSSGVSFLSRGSQIDIICPSTEAIEVMKNKIIQPNGLNLSFLLKT